MAKERRSHPAARLEKVEIYSTSVTLLWLYGKSLKLFLYTKTLSWLFLLLPLILLSDKASCLWLCMYACDYMYTRRSYRKYNIFLPLRKFHCVCWRDRRWKTRKWPDFSTTFYFLFLIVSVLDMHLSSICLAQFFQDPDLFIPKSSQLFPDYYDTQGPPTKEKER